MENNISEKDNFYINLLMEKSEEYQNRYIEAENLLISILKMPWYKRVFSLNSIIMLYIKKRLDETDK